MVFRINGDNITHLLFVDDILLFMEDDDDTIDNVKNVIRLFELVSGLNVNLHKSIISFINSNAQRTNCVAEKWGISTKFLPIQYLGVPLGGKPLSRSFWSETT